MKAKGKILKIFTVFFVCVVALSTSSVFAKTTKVTNITDHSSTRYTATGAGGDVDHSEVQYWLDGERAYCIQAGIPIHNDDEYRWLRNIDDTRFSWLIYNYQNSDQELLQATIWALVGRLGINGSHVINEPAEIQATINAATAGIEAEKAAIPNASISFEQNFQRNKASNTYEAVVATANASGISVSGAPGDTRVDDLGGGRYRIVIPATSIENDISVGVTANCGATGKISGPAQVWGDEVHQEIILPTKQDYTGQNASTGGIVEARGDGSVKKLDEHKKPIAGARYTVTGPEYPNGQQFTTTEEGFELSNIKVGTYTITEDYVPGTLVRDQQPKTIQIQSGRTTTLEFVNDYQRGSAELSKEDYYEGKTPRGDSVLEGAVYQLRAREDIYEGVTKVLSKDDVVATKTTDANGMTGTVKEFELNGFQFDGLPINTETEVGKYYWKEIRPSEGFNINEEEIDIEVRYKGMDYADADKVDCVGKEVPMKGRMRVIKYNDNPEGTEEIPAKGAVLLLTLNSDPSQQYEVTIDENGYANFVDEDFVEKFVNNPAYQDVIQRYQHFDEKGGVLGYTIPYGKYTLTEKEATDGNKYYFIQDEPVNIDKQGETEERIVADMEIEANLHVTKEDSVSKLNVTRHTKGSDEIRPEAKAHFIVWDCQENKLVNQRIYWEDTEFGLHSGDYTYRFSTNEEGEFVTPDTLRTGDYILYEIKAPEGYAISPNVQLPFRYDSSMTMEDLNKAIGKLADKGGYKFSTGRIENGIKDGQEYPEGGVGPGDVIHNEEIENKPLTAKLQLYKTGEMAIGTTSSQTDYGTLYNVEYENRGLADVTFKITALEDVTSPDGKYTYTYQGESWNITTDSTGYATSPELFVGVDGARYLVEEIRTPEGYAAAEPFEVKLTNEEGTYEAALTEKDVNNQRQTFGLNIEKRFEDPKYGPLNEPPRKAVFGLYTNEDIYTPDGILLRQDSLVSLIETDEVYDDQVLEIQSNVKLPEGNYVLKELDTTDPYDFVDDINVVLSYEGNAPVVELPKIEVINTPDEPMPLAIIKVSTSSLATTTWGTNYDEDEVEAKTQEILSELKTMSIDEANEYLQTSDLITVGGAVYGVFYDEEGNNPVYNKKTGEKLTLTTKEKELTVLDGLPKGLYYLIEIEPPFGYELNAEPIEVLLYDDSEVTASYVVAKDPIKYYYEFNKKDKFTGDPVPNCSFEFKDKDGNIVHKGVSDSEGLVAIPLDLLEKGEKYTFTETDAPDLYKQYGQMYELNTEPHEFVADWEVTENSIEFKTHLEVENIRPTRKLIVRKTDSETGNPLQGCVFSIIEIDPQTREPKLNRNGEYIYMVKDAVTDENGEFTVEKAPKGSWKFVEVQAPEGYDLEEQDLEGYEFDITDDSPETIIFEVTNTGDIAVIAIACVAIVCLVGIAYVVVKNKKQNATK